MSTSASGAADRGVSLASLAAALLLVAYGTAGVAFSSRNLGDTVDEQTYREAGVAYLTHLDFRINRDHPPLAKLIGAAYPVVSGRRDVPAFRLGHVVMYGVGGLLSIFLLWGEGLPLAALAFALLYALCPTLKAMAALDVTDFEVALFSLLAAWALWRKRPAFRGAGAFAGLAAASKLTGLFYLPFLALEAAQGGGRGARSRRNALVSGFVFSLVACYLGWLPGLRWFGSAFVFQLHHGVAGHDTFAFGERSNLGHWYYYAALFVLKSPPVILAVVAWGLGALAVRWREHRLELRLFFAPAAALLLVLSLSRVQIGLRYFLPGMILIYAGCAVTIARAIRAKGSGAALAVGLAVLCGAAASGIVADHRVLLDDAYLAYFNPWVSRPTRRFADSNNDWGQGIPHRARARLPRVIDVEDLEAGSLPSGNVYVSAGASQLAGIWSDSGRALRAKTPRWTVAGYEIFELSRLDALNLLHRIDLDGTIPEIRQARVATASPPVCPGEPGRGWLLILSGFDGGGKPPDLSALLGLARVAGVSENGVGEGSTRDMGEWRIWFRCGRPRLSGLERGRATLLELEL